jgi:hypothetical protein
MQYHFSIMHDLVASRHADYQRAAEAHKLASAVPGPGLSPARPGYTRRWLGDRLVALGLEIAGEPAPAPGLGHHPATG